MVITERVMFGRQFIAGILVLLVLSFISVAQERKCASPDKTAKYKVLFEDISENGVFLEIYIEPRRFRVDYLLKVAARLKSEYCRFDEVDVRFYDTRTLDKLKDPLPVPLDDWESKTPMRGFYELDRLENKEEMAFLETRKDQTFDVEIKFDERGYCVSEEIQKPDEPSR